MLTVYQWRILEKDKRGRDRWRTLRWHMTAEDARRWSASNSRAIEMVPGSAEHRRDYYGEGVGQYVSPAPGRRR